MRRVPRHLFTLCSAASLTLCVAMTMLWVRSFFAEDHVQYISLGPERGNLLQLRSALGRLEGFAFETYSGFFQGKPRGLSIETGKEPLPAEATGVVYGFRFDQQEYTEMRYTMVSVPHALVLALMAGTSLLALRGRRRHPPGVCRACGYDLRATRDRCPECGAAAVPA